MRNFLVGLIGSAAVAAVGLGAASYLVPQRVSLAPAPAAQPAPEKTPETTAETTPEPLPKAAQLPAPEAAPQTPPQATRAPAPEAATQPAPDIAPQAAPAAVPEPAPTTQAAPQPEPMLDPAPQAPVVPEATPVEPAGQQPSLQPPAPTIQAEPTPPPAIAPLAPAPLALSSAPPLQAFAAPFAGAADKPLFAIVLLDTGAEDIDRAVLASLPFPVTFAVDPDSPTAPAAMALYRAAGKEVVIYANSLPIGATAQDIAQSFSVYSAVLPETVAVMSPPQGGFQDDLSLSALALPEIASTGRGVVLVQKGLNSAGQIAQRTGIPYASIGRILDATGESVPVMRRYLDRAVFAAAQDGAAVVMGKTLPDTITALTEWAVEGRASEVTLAPISAMMQQ
jgi:uncharacterized protein